MDDQNNIIGIDLGTTNCCISLWRNNKYEIIPDKYGNKIIPSYITITKNNFYAGIDSKKQAEYNVNNTFYNLKRLIGKTYSEIKNEIFLFKIKPDVKDNILLVSDYGDFYVEEIYAKLLIEIKKYVYLYLKYEEYRVVITVPSYFNDIQRQSIYNMTLLSDLICLRLINEPTAASLSYGYETTLIYKSNKFTETFSNNNIMENNNRNVLICDIGGGTTDITILDISHGTFMVLASHGNIQLGGIDYDNILFDYCITKFCGHNNLQNETSDFDPENTKKLFKKCEEAKIKLSKYKYHNIYISNFYNEFDLNVDIDIHLFNEITEQLSNKCTECIDETIKSCDIDKTNIDTIILVGGTTNIVSLKNKIKKYFDKEPIYNINPDFVVSIGAAIIGFILTKKRDPFTDKIALLDIIPLSLGTEIQGGLMDIIVKKNSTIPVLEKKYYTNDKDTDDNIAIKIYEGERLLTRDNDLIAEFYLENINKRKGEAKIELSFSVDINGIISVEATEFCSDSKANITIRSKKKTNEYIDDIIKKSKNKKNEDNIKKKEIELYYRTKDMIDMIEYNLNSSQSDDIENKKNILSNIKCNLKEEENIGYYNSILYKMEENFADIIFNYENYEYDNNYTTINNDGGDNNDNDNDNNDINNRDDINNDYLIKYYNLIEQIKEKKKNMTDNKEIDRCCYLQNYIDEQIIKIYTCKINDDELNLEFRNIMNMFDNINITPKNELTEMCNILLSIEPKKNVEIKNFLSYIKKIMNNINIMSNNECIKEIDIINNKSNNIYKLL